MQMDMYNKLFKITVFSILTFCWNCFYAQHTISGSVSDENGEAIIGVTIKIPDLSVGSSTDLEGNYSISNIPAGPHKVIFSAVGLLTVSESIDFIADVKKNISMREDALLLEEAVVIGYGTARTKDLTGSAVIIKSEDFNKGSVTTPEQLVMGKIPGVKINSNNGAPGSGSRIRIRGGTSINASNDPLIVIDGVPLDNGGIAGAANPLNLINPNDIESFVVLKDASATAIYGSRGANGVILITTKKGKGSDKIKVNLTTNNSLSTIVKYTDVLSADEYRGVINANGSQNQMDDLGEASTNWQEQIYRNALIQENNVYKLCVNEDIYIVPLWHNELHFSTKDNEELIVLCNPTLPDNISIDENNNIIIDYDISFSDVTQLLQNDSNFEIQLDTHRKILFLKC